MAVCSCLEDAVFERLRQLLSERTLCVRQEGVSVVLENAQVLRHYPFLAVL